MITLDATTKSLELVTTTTAGIDYYVAYAELTSTTVQSLQGNGAISTATTTTILAAPASSTQRQVKYVTIVNTSSTASNTVTVQINSSSSTRRLYGPMRLYPGESIQYTANGTWSNYGSNGRLLTPSRRGVPMDAYQTFFLGQPNNDGVGVWCIPRPVCSGSITDWTSPGLAGDAVSHSNTNNAGGFFPIKTTGDQYLTSISQRAADRATWMPIDIVWRNTGLSITSTSAQTINSVAFAPRDVNGSADGLGIQVGILAPISTSNWGNAAQTAPGTISYTNSEGTSGRTGTIMPVVSTFSERNFVPIRLQAGDLGVRSIQTFTWSVSMVSGTAYLIAYRPLSRLDMQWGTNDGSVFTVDPTRIYPDSAIAPLVMTTASAGGPFLWGLGFEVY